MKNLTFFGGLLSILFVACKNQAPTVCQAAEKITVQSSCYEPAQGLTFTASGYGSAPIGFEWDVYATNDTIIGHIEGKKVQIVGSESIVVPDSIIKDNPRVIVQEINNCSGTLIHSRFTSFIRTTANNCTVWIPQDK